jgi:predicted RNA-binding protein associated with RNAse of E/G family
MVDKKFPLFSMCSIYSKEKRPICACFLAKDKKIVEEIKKLSIDALTWSCLGSGVISLYDLECEINGKRIWDIEGISDKEFIEECKSSGIKVFGVIFTGQGYEIGIKTDEKEEKIIEFGRCDKNKKFWGLEEFYKNRYPKLFKGYKHYFKEDKKITSFLKETACRTINNELSRCYWTQELEKYYDIKTYLMCKNSPHWKNYLKKIIEMQIDAGVSGILFDETASPYEAGILAGFCKYCIKNFRNFLIEKYGNKYKNFDYRKFLKKRGHSFGTQLNNFRNAKYGVDFLLFQKKAIRENLKELVEHTKNYAREKRRDILITGNFGELLPYYFHLSSLVDIFNLELVFKIPPEERNTASLKLAKKLAKDKPVTLVPSIFNSAYLRNKNKAVELEKYFISECASSLTNYQIPYSCFTIEGEGSYYPDVESLKTYQEFIAKNQDLFVDVKEFSSVYLLFSYYSYFFTFNWLKYKGDHFNSFSGCEKLLSEFHIPYEVILFGDNEYLEEIPDIEEEKPLFIPGVEYLSDAQIEFLKNYKNEIYIFGKFANFFENSKKRKEILKIENAKFFEDFCSIYNFERREDIREKFLNLISNIYNGLNFKTNLPDFSILNIYQKKKNLFFHIVNSNYIESEDRFIPLKNIDFNIKNLENIKSITLYTPEKNQEKIIFTKNNNDIVFKIDEIKIYGVIKIEKD